MIKPNIELVQYQNIYSGLNFDGTTITMLPGYEKSDIAVFNFEYSSELQSVGFINSSLVIIFPL